MNLQLENGSLCWGNDRDETLDILFAGDLCPRGGAEARILRGEKETLLAGIMAELSAPANDLSVVNLETPLTRSEEGIVKSGPNLKVAPEIVELIKSGHWDVACCANNHIGDYGEAAVIETLDLLRRHRIEQVGAGRDLTAARKPLTVERGGQKISLLAFAENEFGIAGPDFPGANPLQPLRNISQIRAAAAASDITIVMIHGGNEYNPVPSPRVVDTYRAFAEAGATAVIGGHTHCPQGMELWQGVPIIYSLGNFMFPSQDLSSASGKVYTGYNWWYGYMIRIGFAGSRAVKLEAVPHCCGPLGEDVRLLTGSERETFLEYLNYISTIIGDETEVARYFAAWCMFRMDHTVTLAGKRFYPPDWNNPEAVATLMSRRNQCTCEAHNELMTTTLKILADRREEAARGYLGRLEQLSNGNLPGR